MIVCLFGGMLMGEYVGVKVRQFAKGQSFGTRFLMFAVGALLIFLCSFSWGTVWHQLLGLADG